MYAPAACLIERYRGHGPLLQFGVWFISGVASECMRLQDAGLNNTAPVRPGMDAGRANRAMDNFVGNKIEQP